MNEEWVPKSLYDEIIRETFDRLIIIQLRKYNKYAEFTNNTIYIPIEGKIISAKSEPIKYMNELKDVN